MRKTWTLGGGTAEETYYVYDIAGKLAAEYGTGSNTAAATVYPFTDMLGSVRAVTDGNGAVLECYDYLPFGRMLSSSDNQRSASCHPSSPDTALDSETSQKFTGQIRDEETRLDYFGARYYSAPQGRFLSADAPLLDQHRENPQSWNLYTYVRNNPLKYHDQNGRWCVFGFGTTCEDDTVPPKPLPPPVPPGLPGSPQFDLVHAQDKTRANPAFQPGEFTYCNQATCAIAAALGAPLDPLHNSEREALLANDQARNLASSPDYRKVGPEEAQRIANAGGVVIVAWENPTGASGHVATVRPEGVPGDRPPAPGVGPLLNDIGQFVRVANKNFAFGKNRAVYYYTPRDR